MLLISDKIRAGYGEKRIRKLVENKLNNNIASDSHKSLTVDDITILKIEKNKMIFPKNITTNESFKDLQKEIEQLVKQWYINEHK